MHDTPIHPTTSRLIRACALGALFASLTACVTVGQSRSASSPAAPGSAGSLAAPAPSQAGMAQPVAAARLTREALANTYQTYNEHGFGFALVLRKDGTSTMEVPDFDTNKVAKVHGKWALNADRITIEQKVGKKADRLEYVVREALKPSDPSMIPGCRGAFGLEAVKVYSGESLGDYFVWPKQAILAEQAPCPKVPTAQRAQPASKR